VSPADAESEPLDVCLDELLEAPRSAWVAVHQGHGTYRCRAGADSSLSSGASG